MVINYQFNKYFWKTIITDIKQNLKHPIELDHKVFGKVKVDLSRLSKDGIHQLLKQLTNFPKDEKGVAKSLTEVDNKELLKHINLIKLMMNMNGFTFMADDEEWERLIQSTR